MKAEHRKELETNALADSMGRAIQRIRTRPQGRSVLYFILFLVAVGLVAIFWWIRHVEQVGARKAWAFFEGANRQDLDILAGFAPNKNKDYEIDPTNNTRWAARFQTAWFMLWEDGIKKLGANPRGAMNSIRDAEKVYKSLAEECKDDPVWGPEAHYSLAVITETKAVQNRNHLKQALDLYEKVARDYKDSGYGKLAKKQAASLKENFAERERFYQSLQSEFKVDDEVGVPGGQNLRQPAP